MILASKSPRRKEILEKIGFNLQIKSKEIEEISDKENNILKIEDIAYKKVFAVAQENRDSYVVGADTIVELEGVIIGKPKDEKDAKEILKKLSGKIHNVITAYCFMNIEKKIKIVESVVTKVYFKTLDEGMIDWYIKSLEPMDKAGAYGIQDKGSIFVEKIEGDFFTVMGFPISRFIEKLREIGIKFEDIKKL